MTETKSEIDRKDDKDGLEMTIACLENQEKGLVRAFGIFSGGLTVDGASLKGHRRKDFQAAKVVRPRP